MRIFIGIKLDTTAIEQTEKFLKPFKKIACPIRWVKPGNIHITLKFIGEIPDKKYPPILQAVTEAAASLHAGEFDVTLSGCGKFGPRDTLNIFWVGIAPQDTLTQLYEKIENSLFKIGIPKEDRPFKPHITIGRNKKDFNFKPVFNLIDENKDRKITGMHVTHFQLFESQLAPEGPVYTILKEIPLVEE
jgi:RNA 2',3'-cyclic 3'-phosphodiesterase